MKYKKRSLKKKQRQQRQRQRHHFSKKYIQRGGGFMETIAELIGMEGRTHTCMAVHPTQPLVAVGDDAGTITLWEINQPQPKKLAQSVGLPTAVKCLEFHKTFPLVAGACNDRVLMWRFDQISREQEQQQEGAVQQLEPSHTVGVFALRSQEVVEKELSKTQQILAENKQKQGEIFQEQVTIENNLRDIDRRMRDINEDKGMNGYPGFTRGADHLERMLKFYERTGKDASETLTKLEPLRQELKELQTQEDSKKIRLKELKTLVETISIFNEEEKIRHLKSELEMIRAGARNEVSCIAFRPGNTMSYIAVGVNNNKHKTDNRIIMYRFKLESSSVEKSYSLPTNLEGEPKEAHPDVSLVSFSHNGALFAFVTKSSDGGTVLNVIIFKGSSGYYSHEFRVYKIDQHATSIMSYKSDLNERMDHYQHQFIIGCDNGSLLMTQATTLITRGFSVTSVTDLKSIREWNAGEEPIKCVAVHPSLPLFASGTRGVVTLWDINEPKPLVVQPQVTPVRSVGFNQKFLAACGPGSMRFYSCNSDDYRDLKLEPEEKVALFVTDVTLANRRGEDCIICGEQMNDPLSQPSLRLGPKEAQEIYLTCGHKFHNNDSCIKKWVNQGGKCPLCNQTSDFQIGTPERIRKLREKFIKENFEKSTRGNNEKLFMRAALDFGKGPIAQGSPVRFLQGIHSDQQQPPQSSERPDSTPLTLEELRAARLADIERRRNEQQQQPSSSENSGGSKNKYTRRKNRSKKSKISRRYSKKYKYKLNN
jgi:WD40 repeat protein